MPLSKFGLKSSLKEIVSLAKKLELDLKIEYCQESGRIEVYVSEPESGEWQIVVTEDGYTYMKDVSVKKIAMDLERAKKELMDKKLADEIRQSVIDKYGEQGLATFLRETNGHY